MQGNIIKKRLASFVFEDDPDISLNFKLFSVQDQEYKKGIGLLTFEF